MYCLNTRVIFLFLLNFSVFVISMQPKPWQMCGFIHILPHLTDCIPMLFVFLRIILNGCMVCRFVYKAKCKSPLYSFPFPSFISLSVQETALPLRSMPFSTPSCQDAPDQFSLPLGAGCAAASPCNTLIAHSLPAYSYILSRAHVKCHCSREPSRSSGLPYQPALQGLSHSYALHSNCVSYGLFVHQTVSRSHFFFFFEPY